MALAGGGSQNLRAAQILLKKNSDSLQNCFGEALARAGRFGQPEFPESEGSCDPSEKKGRLFAELLWRRSGKGGRVLWPAQIVLWAAEATSWAVDICLVH